MLNVILILSMAFNLAAGLFFIAKLEPVVWGRHSYVVSRRAAIRDTVFLIWDHQQFYLRFYAYNETHQPQFRQKTKTVADYYLTEILNDLIVHLR